MQRDIQRRRAASIDASPHHEFQCALVEYLDGFAIDPQGPASNPTGVKVIRGGAWDAGEADCRLGRRLTEGVSPFIHDFILGFRVVLVPETWAP